MDYFYWWVELSRVYLIMRIGEIIILRLYFLNAYLSVSFSNNNFQRFIPEHV